MSLGLLSKKVGKELVVHSSNSIIQTLLYVHVLETSILCLLGRLAPFGLFGLGGNGFVIFSQLSCSFSWGWRRRRSVNGRAHGSLNDPVPDLWRESVEGK
jgi:hypothetical protein